MAFLKNTASPKVHSEIKDKVRTFVQEVVKSAKKTQYTRKVNFSYSDTSYGDIVSCSIMASVTSSTTKNYKTAFTVDVTSPKILSLNDIFNSKNALTIVNTIINNTIITYPDTYNITEKLPLDPQNFYVENNVAVVIYNNYSFKITLGSIKDFTIDKANYYSKETFDLKMVPLRVVCDQFGYSIDYAPRTKEIKITKGEFETFIKIGENSYSTDLKHKRTLDASPELSNSITYVPVSFFEQILNVFYKIEASEITFSQYNE